MAILPDAASGCEGRPAWLDPVVSGHDSALGDVKTEEGAVARRRLGFWRRFTVVALKPWLVVLSRRSWTGMEHVPQTGGVILVANHISHADPLVLGHYVYDAGRWPQFLSKASLFKVPVVGTVLHHVRQIPVERGSVDAVRALDAAVAAVKSGAAVIFYPEGTTTREPDLWPMRGKTGAARLATLTGAPVIPIVTWGAERIFDPRTAKLRIRPRMPVAVAAGPPIDLSRWAGMPANNTVLHEMTDLIMLRLRDMVAEIRGGTPPPLYVPSVTRKNGSAGSDADDGDGSSGDGGLSGDGDSSGGPSYPPASPTAPVKGKP
jgi:1-acyl-sn-glycerol-3-phosphate acyltransferase